MAISSEEMKKKKQSAPKAHRTSKRIRNMKVLSSPIFVFGDNDDHDDEPVLIAEEDIPGYVSPSSEPVPIPRETTPQTASPTLPSPPKYQPNLTSTKSTSSVLKEKEQAAVPNVEEQSSIPNPKEPSVVPNPDFPFSSSQNPTIGSTYTLEHAKRLDNLFTLVMGKSEAMMEFAGEVKDVNGLVKGLSNKVDVALKGHEVIFVQLHTMTTTITQLNTTVMNLESIVSKLLEKVESNHSEVMKKLEDVMEEVVEIPSSPKP